MAQRCTCNYQGADPTCEEGQQLLTDTTHAYARLQGTEGDIVTMTYDQRWDEYNQCCQAYFQHIKESVGSGEIICYWCGQHVAQEDADLAGIGPEGEMWWCGCQQEEERKKEQ